MELNRDALLAGTVDPAKVKMADLSAFIAANGLAVSVAGKNKAAVLNDICDALEGATPDADSDTPASAATVLGDPAVLGSNYLARRADKIKAGRSELNGIPTDLADEAKKSNYIARRFKKMNPKG
jgi:hypothetical protein